MFVGLLKKIVLLWSKYSRVEIIGRHEDTDTPYLVRYHLINNSFFKLYFHKFLRSDRDCPHDHPFAFWTLMLQGSYTEQLYDWRTRTLTSTRRTPTEHALIYRSADALHRVIVDQNLPIERMDEAPMTLFLTGAKTQEWGFVLDYETAPKWTHWKTYLGVK